MDMDSEKKEHCESVSIDLTELDRHFKMVKNELYMKRALVSQLRTQLDEINLKNYELTKALEKTEAELNESKLNFNLMSRKCSIFESKLQKNRDVLERNQLQREMEVPEKEILKGKIGQLQMENYNLRKELDEMKMRYKYETAFRNDLNDREAKIKISMQELRGVIDKYEKENEASSKRIQQSQSYETIVCSSEFLAQELEKLKREKSEMEEKNLILSVKCQKFEELFNSDLDIVEGNVTTKLIFKHWQTSMESYRRNAKFHNDSITELTKQLTQEREAAKALISQHEEDALKIGELQKEVADLKKSITTERCFVKREVIHIE